MRNALPDKALAPFAHIGTLWIKGGARWYKNAQHSCAMVSIRTETLRSPARAGNTDRTRTAPSRRDSAEKGNVHLRRPAMARLSIFFPTLLTRRAIRTGYCFLYAAIGCLSTLATGAQQSVGLALEINNGRGVPLSVKAGHDFHLNQIDIRTSIKTGDDQGIAPLKTAGMFAKLPWDGLRYEEDFAEPEQAGGFHTRRRFFTGARWMQQPATFVVTPLDARGKATAPPVVIAVGHDKKRKITDTMFINRLRAIQWTRDCTSATSCTGARDFEAEALIELRNSLHRDRKLLIGATTSALQVRWSLLPAEKFLIPVERIGVTEYAYGYSIAVDALTPPRPDGSYPPGEKISFRLSQLDGAGKRLHPQGSLPTYTEFRAGRNDSGLQYYRGFDEPAVAYYRRKHRERMLMAQIVGPVQLLSPIRSIVQIDDFLGSNVTQKVGRPERDGIYAEFQLFPPSNDLFGGAFDPQHAGWDVPVSDQFTFHVPKNAESGTYLVTVKGRRVYLGEDIPASRTIEIQVGTTQRTEPRLTATNCSGCHKEGSALTSLLHGNGNLAACNACHSPLAFEPDNATYVRIHFIHSRSDRFRATLAQCSACHREKASVQRASKAACMSCHKSYPDSHVQLFGPIRSIYVGGRQEPFASCAENCHQAHAGSGFSGDPKPRGRTGGRAGKILRDGLTKNHGRLSGRPVD